MIEKYDLSESKSLDSFSVAGTGKGEEFPYAVDMGGIYECEDTYYTYRDSSPFSLLLYTCSGCGQIEYRDYQGILPVGHMILLDGKYAHRYATKKGGKWKFIWMHYFDRSPCSFSDYFYRRGMILQPVKIDEVVGFFEKMKYLSVHPTIFQKMEISQCLSHFLYESGIHGEEKVTPVLDSGEQIVNLAQDYMQTHFQEAISLEKLGVICGVSKFYLIKLFGKWTGMTPHQYLLQVRVGKAKLLLLSTERTVGEIGNLTGFSGSSLFIEAFKKQTGQTPLEFRNAGK